MLPAVLGSITSGHGPNPPQTVIEGSPDVTIEGKPAAYVGCHVTTHGIEPTPHDVGNSATISQGSSTVFVNGQPMARMFDPISCAPGVNVIIQSASTVLCGQ